MPGGFDNDDAATTASVSSGIPGHSQSRSAKSGVNIPTFAEKPLPREPASGMSILSATVSLLTVSTGSLTRCCILLTRQPPWQGQESNMDRAVSLVMAIPTVALRIGLDMEIRQARPILAAMLLSGPEPLGAVPIVTTIPRGTITLRRLTAHFPLEAAPLPMNAAPQPPFRTHRTSPTKSILVSIVMLLVQWVVLITGQNSMVMVPQLQGHTRRIWPTRLILVSIVLVLLPRIILATGQLPIIIALVPVQYKAQATKAP